MSKGQRCDMNVCESNKKGRCIELFVSIIENKCCTGKRKCKKEE